MSTTSAINLVLADAQPVFRAGIKSLLAAHEDLHVICEAGNTTELLPALKLYKPDILILDYNPSYFNGEELATVLLEQPDCKVIIISSQEKKWNIFKSLEFNVYCYLTKECGTQDVYTAIRAAAKGEKFFCTFILNILLGDKTVPVKTKSHQPGCLTERECEIVKLVAQGKVNKEIASELHLSPHTIHTHRKNIMKKLGLHPAVELANYAKTTGIVQ